MQFYRAFLFSFIEIELVMTPPPTSVCLIFCLSILLSSPVFSQGQEILAGKIVDSKTGEPVPYASVRVKDKSIGVVANDAGDFQMSIRIKAQGDSIIVTSIGYNTGHFSFDIFDPTKVTTLRISPTVTQLTEAVVRGK